MKIEPSVHIKGHWFHGQHLLKCGREIKHTTLVTDDPHKVTCRICKAGGMQQVQIKRHANKIIFFKNN
jgi:uncharacterized Zn ribbon protein